MSSNKKNVGMMIYRGIALGLAGLMIFGVAATLIYYLVLYS